MNAMQGYGWLKDRILGEDGRRQQMQLRELSLIAEQLGCSLAQLAIGQCMDYLSYNRTMHAYKFTTAYLSKLTLSPAVLQCQFPL